MIAHASPFKGTGTLVQGCSRGSATATFEIYYDRRDISVIYLFVEGSYVGEAYCQAFMGQRVSEWEAAAMRQHDRAKAKAARAASASVRVHMHEEIEAAKKQRRRVTRVREQARQFDRQREEIHPAQVLSELEARLPPPPASFQLPAAKPDPEKAYPVHHLVIRYRDREPSP
jgi:hypothetical protein